MDETTFRPENPTLLEMYSDGEPLGIGIGLGGERWKEQRRFAARALRDLGAGKKGEYCLYSVLAGIKDEKANTIYIILFERSENIIRN